jgi:ABC-type glucose/galactose transport system permease subunit
MGAECLTADFTTSSTTRVSTNLSFAIAANEVFVVDVFGTCKKATSATGLKFAIDAPAGCTIAGFQLGGGATLAALPVPSLISAINTLGTTLATGTNIQVTFALRFRVVNGANAGAITIQTATVTSNTATIYAGAAMFYQRATQV